MLYQRGNKPASASAASPPSGGAAVVGALFTVTAKGLGQHFC